MSHYFPLSKLHLKRTAAFSTRHRVLGNPVSAGVLTWAQVQATGNNQEDGKAALGWEGAFSSHVPDGLIPTTHEGVLPPTNENPQESNQKSSRVGLERRLKG